MKAAILKKLTSLKDNKEPLEITEVPEPTLSDGEILVKVAVCGVCHTEIDEIEGRIPPTILPVILGHQVVGIVTERGILARKFAIGDRVGVGWINSAAAIVWPAPPEMKIFVPILKRPAEMLTAVTPSIWRYPKISFLPFLKIFLMFRLRRFYAPER